LHILGILVLVIVAVLYFTYTDTDQTTDVTPPTTEQPEVTETEETTQADPGSTQQESADADDAEVKEFTLDAFSFGYSQEELVVNEGDTVTINLTNSDGFHDWVLDEFDAETEQISEGETTSVTFVAGEAGTYEYYCSVGQHRANGMVGTLVVE
jgi:plastocyanin